MHRHLLLLSVAALVAALSAAPVAAESPFIVAPGADWIPIETHRDIVAGSALDFSGMRLQDAPSGKYGWLRAVGGHFEFEGRPGVPVRFCGGNLCRSACFPDAALADALATRFRRLGWNAIRIHHHDGAWAEAHARCGNDGALRANDNGATRQMTNDGNFVITGVAGSVIDGGDAIDRMDCFLSRLFEAGLYVTTDLYVSRQVPWRDIGVDRDGDVPANLFKALCAVYEPAFENWAAFARNFLEHVNPYTGRRYADEPALPLLSMVNEGVWYPGWKDIAADPRIAASWKAWLERRRADDPSFAPGLRADAPPERFWDGNASPALAQWIGELEARMFARMRDVVRATGCRALLTDYNCGPHFTAVQAASADYDYVDDHFYVDHPKFLDKPWRLPSRCPNENPLRAGKPLPPSEQAFARMADKPYTVTEWNFCGPGRCRGAGGLLAGAMAALQDWSGLWRFAYSHESSGIGDADERRPGFLDMATDPLAVASERAATCLFLRGDLAPFGPGGVSLLVTEESVRTAPEGGAFSAAPPWRDLAWTTRVSSRLRPDAAEGATLLRREEAETAESPVPADAARGDAGPPANGIRLDRERGAFAIVTPRTCGGFAESGTVEAGPLRFTLHAEEMSHAESTEEYLDLRFVDNCEQLEFVNNSSAAIWASSLDGEPLVASRRILLAHLTDVQGDGAVFDDETMRVMRAWGARPLARDSSAEIELSLADAPASRGWRVYALSSSGARRFEVPAEFRDGALCFTAAVRGEDGNAVLEYEIVRE